MLSVGAPPSTAALPHLIRRHCPLPCLLLLFGSRVDAAVSTPRPGRPRFIPLPALRWGQRGRKLREGDEDAGWSRVSDEDDENDDMDESMLPFQEMREWLRSKPAGFGEGKNYDTRLEDELWEEIERSRKAQIENLNKLKNKPKMSDDRSKTKEKAPHKADEAEPGTLRVRIWNLPRKKNIHRDLQRAFRGFPGLVSISPAIIGNEKTREPVCRGFAFVCLASKEAANRFVQTYSRKTLCFGKVEKQISCVVIKTCGILDSCEPQDDVSDNYSLSKSLKGGIGLFGLSEVAIVTQDSEGRTIQDGSVCIGVTEKFDVEYMLSKRAYDDTPNFENRENSSGHVTIPVLGCLEHGNEVTWNDLAQKESMPQIRKRHKRTSSSKKATKTNQIQAMKPSLPGSMARLKIKERTVLTGVFSKYSRNVASEN